MRRSDLAAKLVGARTAKERKQIFAQSPGLADVRLAYEIKDICYEKWTTVPAQARKAALAVKELALLRGDSEIEAVALWVEGIAAITYGKLEDALPLIDGSYKRFREIGKKYEAAQTDVARLMALALLGRYEAAIKTGKRALKVFTDSGDDFGAGRVELNLSNLYSRLERHRESERFGLSATRRFAKVGSIRWRVMAENGLAITYTNLNDFRRARDLYQTALKDARGEEMLVTEAEIESSLGDLAAKLGNYADAVRYLESSRQKYLEIGMRHNTAVADLEIGASYLKLHLVPEAIAIFERAASELRKLELKPEEAKTLILLGRAAAEAKRNSLARRAFRNGGALYREIGNEVGFGLAKLELARVEIGEGRIDVTESLLREAAPSLRRSENRRHLLGLRWLRAEIQLKKGALRRANELFTQLLADGRDLHEAEISLRALNSLGEIAARLGETETAEGYFRDAIAATEATRASLTSDEFRVAYLASSLEPFERLFELLISHGKIDEAFALAQRSRAQALSDSITAQSALCSPSAPVNLAEQATRLREDLNWVYSRAASASENERAKLVGKSRNLERQLASTARQIDSFNSAEGKTRHYSNTDIEGLIRSCGRDTALIEYVRTGSTFGAFVVSRTGVSFFPALIEDSEISEAVEALHFQFASFRYGAALPAAVEQHIKAKTDRLLGSMHEQLLTPLEQELNKIRRLVFVPAGQLNYLPFHAFRGRDKYLIEEKEIVYAPSSAIWQTLTARRSKRIRSSLVVGYADEAIPLVSAELEQVANKLPNPTVLSGQEATFESFLEQAGKFDLLHIACHGQFRGDNPMYSNFRLANGWITANDLLRQKIKAALVTLSACETAVNQIVAGEEIMGLTRGFIAAGANSLILSQWTVNDAATRDLMSQFYDHLRKRAPRSALRLAQLEMIAADRHPYFWAPFINIGK